MSSDLVQSLRNRVNAFKLTSNKKSGRTSRLSDTWISQTSSPRVQVVKPIRSQAVQ